MPPKPLSNCCLLPITHHLFERTRIATIHNHQYALRNMSRELRKKRPEPVTDEGVHASADYA